MTVVWNPNFSGKEDAFFPVSLAPPSVSPALTQKAFQELSLVTYNLELTNDTAVINSTVIQWKLEGSFPVELYNMIFNASIGTGPNATFYEYEMENVSVAENVSEGIHTIITNGCS